MSIQVDISAAASGGEVKASPLFKRSLEESIASLEGMMVQAGTAQGEAVVMPTGKPECPQPDAPPTEISTCEPSWCGGTTCGQATCQGQPTCYSTCGTTCSGSTCTSTCAGGSCQYHYIWRGYNNWNYNGNRGANWNYFVEIYPYASCIYGGYTEIRFAGSNPPPTERKYWYPSDGFFNIDKWYSNPITLFTMSSQRYGSRIFHAMSRFGSFIGPSLFII
jgi:hypothetical protein